MIYAPRAHSIISSINIISHITRRTAQSLPQHELATQLAPLCDLLPHQRDVFHGLVVPELQDELFGVIVFDSAVLFYDLVSGGECLQGLVQHSLPVMQHVHYYVLLYYLPSLSVAQKRVPYLWAYQILDHRSELHALLLPSEQQPIL